jgi:DNA invertase Pin-like site-specific DNA recombinase
MKIGYARVSTDEQNLDLQLQALAAAGCETAFISDKGGSLPTYGRKDGKKLIHWQHQQRNQ